jgi:glycosyltransferase XagB
MQAASRLSSEDLPPASSFSLMVPASRDEAALNATLARVARSDPPPSEVLIVVGSDDSATRDVAERLAGRRPQLFKVVVDGPLFDVMQRNGHNHAPVARPTRVRRAEPSGTRPAAPGVGGMLRKLVGAARVGWTGLSSQVKGRRPPAGSFSLMVPASRDEAALEAALPPVSGSDPPPSEVLVVAGADDPVMLKVAERVSGRRPEHFKVVVDGARFEVMTGEASGDGRVRRPKAVPHTHALLALGVALAAGALVLAAWIPTTSFLYVLYVGVSLALGAIAWTTLVWMVSAWRTPDSLSESGLSSGKPELAHSFSLIVPARHEEAVLERTLSRLVASDHPALEVLVVVGTDDTATREVAERVARRHPEVVKVVLDAGWPKSKPRALNAALPHCKGTIIGVFDAEDDVPPALLPGVDRCFQRTNADVVQGGVQLMNFRSSWLTVRNVLEYYFWFRSRLHRHARHGFIPLGGNTVFIRADVLRDVAGWDADCLAEDCELGVRLSALGARTVVFYEPELVTREECPPTLGAFARQRTRWNQGYLQTLRRGHWRRLPLHRLALGAYILAMPYLMALVWLTIPVAIGTALAVNAPVPITLVSFLPALPMLSMLAVEIAALGDFCRAYGQRPSRRDYGRLALGLPVYQAVLAFAAVRAVVREVRGERRWEKTTHLGLHLAEFTRRENGGAAVSRAPVGAVARSDGPANVAVGATAGGPSGDRTIRSGSGGGGLEREPLSVRLGGTSANGSAALSPKGATRSTRRQQDRLVDARGVVHRLVAARADLVLLVGLVAAVGVVQATNMLHWPATQFDEGTYVGNAWAVQHGALAPYTYSYGHPPLAWLFIALWTWARGIVGDGSYSVDTGRELMLVVSLASCSLLFVLARRLGMGRAFSAAAVILFALSPLGLFYHRAVLLDNPAVAWVLAAFVLAMTPRRRLWAFAGSGGCFAAAVLCKETTLVLLPTLILAAAQNADKRTRRYCLTLFASFLGLIALTYPLYATLKGELLPGPGHVSLVGESVVQLFTRETTGSLFDPDSQTHATVMAWLELDPWLLGAALTLAPVALASRATRAVALAYAIQLAMILRPGYLPNMYVIGVLPFAALIVAGASAALWRRSLATSSRAFAWSMRATLVALAAAVMLVVAPRWSEGDRVAMSARLDGPQRAAQRWLVANVGRDKRLIVGDEVWIYLIQHHFDAHPMRGGFFSRTVVVYWPLDYDPAVKRRFPHGWRDFDYLVSTQAVRSTTDRTPTTARALDHSRVVARFGRGETRIEIRKMTPAGGRRDGPGPPSPR